MVVAVVNIERIRRLRERMLSKKPKICIERAKYYTESMKKTEGQPMVIRQALALANVLDKISVNILPDELIVGTMVSDPPGAIVYPEGIGLSILPEVPAVRNRKLCPLDITDEDAKILKEEIAPYWMNRNLQAYGTSIMPKKTNELFWLASIFVLTEIAGISHVAINYPRLLKTGFKGILELVSEKIRKFEEMEECGPEDIEKAQFYKAARIAAEAVIRFGKRYAAKAEELADSEKDERRKEELLEISRICKRIPENPPETFHEALQFVWLTQVALHQENYEQAISMGRVDQYLYPYYVRDMERGILDRDKAVELVACFLIKANELVPLFNSMVMEYFAGQPTNMSITLGGTDENGNDAVNELTYVFLDAAMLVRMRQPNIHVRVHKNTSPEFLKYLAEYIKSGVNNIALFGDEVIIKALTRLGVPEKEARNYSTIGCVEFAPFGNSFTSSDAALFNIALCLDLALHNGYSVMLRRKLGPETGDPRNFKSMDDVIEAFRKQVAYFVKHMCVGCNCLEIANQVVKPTPLLSLCVDGPLEQGKDITLGSAKYNFIGVQMVGLADVADSLAAIEKFVFKEKKITMEELVEALKTNFKDREDLRQMLLNEGPKYGNDDDEADKYAKLVAKIYSEEVMKHRNVRGGIFIPGAYPMTTFVPFGRFVGALPSGRRAGEPLSNGVSPASGSERKGLTASMRSVTKIDFSMYPNGVSYTVTITPDLFAGDEGTEKLAALIKTYFEMGGMHMHFNVVDVNTLIEAQKNPERYRDLVVRVAGWSAYFVELTKEVQDQIIRRYMRKL
ncbi:MAG: glycyl radical protein [Candidatus Baldrarchaeia archaeon]